MVSPGDVISYVDMCRLEGASLQRGMNFRLRSKDTVVLMSVRRGAPYADRVEDGGSVLIYEGHDAPRTPSCPNPKSVDQPERLPTGTFTQNGLFWEAVAAYKGRRAPAEQVRVYEKIKTGIWAFAGIFELLDAWKEESSRRQVFKFKLRICAEPSDGATPPEIELQHARLIPTAVKIEVWKRDKGRCVKCGSTENLHFDHDLPFSKGGTSLLAKNIQLMCARHNLQKHDRIE
jgi:HNH endonuclease